MWNSCLLHLDEYKINIHSTNKGVFVFKAIDLAKRIQFSKVNWVCSFLSITRRKTRKIWKPRRFFSPVSGGGRNAPGLLYGKKKQRKERKKKKEIQRFRALGTFPHLCCSARLTRQNVSITESEGLESLIFHAVKSESP